MNFIELTGLNSLCKLASPQRFTDLHNGISDFGISKSAIESTDPENCIYYSFRYTVHGFGMTLCEVHDR